MTSVVFISAQSRFVSSHGTNSISSSLDEEELPPKPRAMVRVRLTTRISVRPDSCRLVYVTHHPVSARIHLVRLDHRIRDLLWTLRRSLLSDQQDQVV